MIPLTENPRLEARTGHICAVRHSGENIDNTFWAPLIGKRGIVVRVDADGLITVSLDGAIVVEGVRQSRFTFSTPVKSSKPWWSRLMFWRR